jgi:hypothetical protein
MPSPDKNEVQDQLDVADPRQLSRDYAVELAESLTTIGHPRFKAAIDATAEDLIRWCHGGIKDNIVWNASQQASYLVRQARLWEDGWPERGGTARLRELFERLFKPKRPPSNALVDYSEEPCVCGSGKKFGLCCNPWRPCDCGSGMAFKDCCSPERESPIEVHRRREAIGPARSRQQIEDDVAAAARREADVILADPAASEAQRARALRILNTYGRVQ